MAQYAKKRAALEAIINNDEPPEQERYEARLKLQACRAIQTVLSA